MESFEEKFKTFVDSLKKIDPKLNLTDQLTTSIKSALVLLQSY